MNRLETFLHSLMSAGALQAASDIDPSKVNDIVKLLGQFVLIVAGLWQMFKRKK